MPTVPEHIALVIFCLVCGAAFWLGDDFIAERTAISREVEKFAPHVYPDPDDSREKKLWEREAMSRTARITGKVLTALAAVFGALLLARLLT